MTINQGSQFEVTVNIFELLLATDSGYNVLSGTINLSYSYIGVGSPPSVSSVRYGIRTGTTDVVVGTFLPIPNATWDFSVTIPNTVVGIGDFYLFAELSCTYTDDAQVYGDIVSTADVPAADPWALDYIYRLQKASELSWTEGDDNTRINDLREKWLKTQLLTKLAKALPAGKTFIGNAEDEAEPGDFPNPDLSAYALQTWVTEQLNNIDLSNFYTKLQSDNLLTQKVDKVSGKSLISDTEITRLATILGIGTKEFNETGLVDKSQPIYDAVSGKFKVIETANFSIINFSTSVLADEKYWRNNFNSSLAPSFAGQVAAGTSNLGNLIQCIAVGSGFVRTYAQPFIDASSGYGLTVANLLQTSTGWVDSLKTISADSDGRNGDIGMKHSFGEFAYECIARTGTGNANSVWRRTQNKDVAALTNEAVLFANAAGQAVQSTNFKYNAANNLLTVGNLLLNISEYADNTAALAAGLTAGKLYRTGDLLKIVH